MAEMVCGRNVLWPNRSVDESLLKRPESLISVQLSCGTVALYGPFPPPPLFLADHNEITTQGNTHLQPIIKRPIKSSDLNLVAIVPIFI